MPTKSIAPNEHLKPRSHAPAGGSNLIASFKNDIVGQTTTSFASSTNVMLGDEASAYAGVTTLYHGNQQYSVTAISDSSGNVSERYAYTAYGQPTFLNASGAVQTSSAASNRYTFTGREWDATLGLYHFRARWMSGMTGRFLTRDPIGYNAGVNIYSFVRGRSLFQRDPLGLQEDGYQKCINTEPVPPPSGPWTIGANSSHRYDSMWTLPGFLWPVRYVYDWNERVKYRKSFILIASGAGENCTGDPKANDVLRVGYSYQTGTEVIQTVEEGIDVSGGEADFGLELKISNKISSSVRNSLSETITSEYRAQIPKCRFRKIALFQEVKEYVREGSGEWTILGLGLIHNGTFSFSEKWIVKTGNIVMVDVCGGDSECDCCKKK